MTYSLASNPLQSPPPASPAAVREQLQRLLAHPLFTNSKRYPVLLAYVVERTLEGLAPELKERTIGVDAFHREAGYDVNLDPVVRMTAAEVRKRLIQYYYAPEHAGQLVIELPLGSYVPSFRAPELTPTDLQPLAANSKRASAATPPAQLLTDRASLFRHLAQQKLACSLLLGTVFALGFAAANLRLPRHPSNLERFWAPITSTSSRITYCLGEPTESTDRARVEDTYVSTHGSLNVHDVVTLARSIVPILPHENSFRVVAASVVQFTQLREGPDVLIGAFDNQWSMRILRDLPYSFSMERGERRIVDRANPRQNYWTFQQQGPNLSLSADYAVVARLNDPTTGQPVILIGGILAEGTEAAGELVSNPEYMDGLVASIPSNWDRMNLEVVLETRVIDGHPGPPKVVAFKTW